MVAVKRHGERTTARSRSNGTLHTGDHVPAGLCTLPLSTSSALHTADHVPTGVCTLGWGGAVQTPLANDPSSAQSPALYTGDPVWTGVCTMAFSTRSAMYTADPVWAGLCTLIAADTVQTPSETAPPVYKVPSTPPGTAFPNTPSDRLLFTGRLAGRPGSFRARATSALPAHEPGRPVGRPVKRNDSGGLSDR